MDPTKENAVNNYSGINNTLKNENYYLRKEIQLLRFAEDPNIGQEAFLEDSVKNS